MKEIYWAIRELVEKTEDPNLLCILHTLLGSIEAGPKALQLFAGHCTEFAYFMREQIMKELGVDETKH